MLEQFKSLIDNIYAIDIMTSIRLTSEEMPRAWYNIQADLPSPLPPPIGDEEKKNLGRYGIKECLRQEFSTERFPKIPEDILKLYDQVARPRDLVRAERLEKALHLPEDKVRLYYKREDQSPTGSHKVNTALAQAYYAAKEEKTRLTTETGAGQWGSALALGAMLNGLKPTVYWVRNVYDWKPSRKELMELMGAEVLASPSNRTKFGREVLEKNPHSPGSLGIAISEGIEDALDDEEHTAYTLGSVLNHVLMHQTVIGLEAKKQLEKVGDYPDYVIGCLGGGSNFGGISLPFIGDVLTGKAPKKKVKFIAAQSEAAPNLSKGEYRYDFADHAEKTPQLKMLTLGHQAEMPPIKGDGLRYHAASPLISFLRHELGLIDVVTFPVDEKYVFERAKFFIRSEGVFPAPESSYAVAQLIDQAFICKKQVDEGKIDKAVLLANISGHGLLDTKGFREVIGDKIRDDVTAEDLLKGLAPQPFS
jgi:tryptophan synthase beta chain